MTGTVPVKVLCVFVFAERLRQKWPGQRAPPSSGVGSTTTEEAKPETCLAKREEKLEMVYAISLAYCWSVTAGKTFVLPTL